MFGGPSADDSPLLNKRKGKDKKNKKPAWSSSESHDSFSASSDTSNSYKRHLKKSKLKKKKKLVNTDDLIKEGYIMKKRSKGLISAWDKRYIVLNGNILTFYDNDKKKYPKKRVDMKEVTSVNFHYDENAPVRSRKLDEKKKDESRFDIYTPHRTYMLKNESGSWFDSEGWVTIL
jgi:hypothetical protein